MVHGSHHCRHLRWATILSRLGIIRIGFCWENLRTGLQKASCLDGYRRPSAPALFRPFLLICMGKPPLGNLPDFIPSSSVVLITPMLSTLNIGSSSVFMSATCKESLRIACTEMMRIETQRYRRARKLQQRRRHDRSVLQPTGEPRNLWLKGRHPLIPTLKRTTQQTSRKRETDRDGRASRSGMDSSSILSRLARIPKLSRLSKLYRGLLAVYQNPAAALS